MDNLIGAAISVISNQEIRYDGILFSINTAESSIVLKDGTNLQCWGRDVDSRGFCDVNCCHVKDNLKEEKRRAS